VTFDVIVVGAGAAGLMAASRSAVRGNSTLLLEKNKKLGVKILMSGGTRCNITHDTDARGIVAAFGKNGSFLHAPLAALGPHQVVDLFEQLGVPTKVESTGKIFPVSDRALDVRDALARYAESSGAHIAAGEAVIEIVRANAVIENPPTSGFRVRTSQRELACRRVILTTGGKSYPGCGTIGEGWTWVRQLGHSIIPPRPALVPLVTREAWMHQLSGLSLEDVELSLFAAANDRRPIDRRRGSFLFTHFGLSGPAPLNISGSVTALHNHNEYRLFANFLPGVERESLRRAWMNAARVDGKRRVVAVLAERFPKSLARALAVQVAIGDDLPMAELSRGKFDALLNQVFRCPIGVDGTKGFEKAEVTAGGVSLDEVDSRTMQSKLVPGLYLAGEILDLDGPIGGFNFQAAFSTGWLAGESIAPSTTRESQDQ
jgi:hypothetical protein